MLDTGTKYPQSALSDSTPSFIAWSDTGNVYAEDTACATTPNFNSISQSRYLRAYNFGFTIPVTANISGIYVGIKRASNTAGHKADNLVRLYSGGYIGDNMAAGGTWGDSLAFVYYGGTTNMWGTTVTASDINDSNFGVGISAKNLDGTSCNAQVDVFTMIVYYTNPMTKAPLPFFFKS